jgi:hypothetical protein
MVPCHSSLVRHQIRHITDNCIRPVVVFPIHRDGKPIARCDNYDDGCDDRDEEYDGDDDGGYNNDDCTDGL